MNIKRLNMYMIITKKTKIQTNIHLGDVSIERVEKYNTWEPGFQKTILCNKGLRLALRIRALRLFSILQYGLKIWTLKQEHINQLRPFELWCSRKMYRTA